MQQFGTVSMQGNKISFAAVAFIYSMSLDDKMGSDL